MTEEIDENYFSLEEIPTSDFVRYLLNKEDLIIYFVKDNPGEKHEEEHVDPEFSDEPHEDDDDNDDHDDHENLNGHLYKVVFKNYSKLIVEGDECDLYRYKNSIIKDNFIQLEFHGINLSESGNDFKIQFSFDKYEIIDCGKIKSPEV